MKRLPKNQNGLGHRESQGRSVRFPNVLLEAARVKGVDMNIVCRRALTAAVLHPITDKEKIAIQECVAELPMSLRLKLTKLLEVHE